MRSASPQSASMLESLTIYFPMVFRDEAELRLHWGTTFVAVRIKAPHRPEPDAAASETARAHRRA